VKLLVAMITVLLGEGAFAAELAEINRSIRALGMGNAYTTIAQDRDALFYNPAALSRVKGFEFVIFDPQLAANGQEIIEDVRSTQSGGSISDTLRQYYGKNAWVGGGFKSAFVAKNLGLAVYDSFDIAANFGNPAFPNLNLRLVNDYGFAMGFSFELLPMTYIGVVGKRVTRFGAELPLGLDTLGTLSDTALREQVNRQGVGYGADVGLLFELPTSVRPKFSFVWKDVGVTKFVASPGANTPPNQRDEMIAGMGLEIESMLVDIRPSIDIKNINRYNEQLGKKVHMGIEFALPFIDVRGGFHQGYYTAGLGVKMGLFKIDAATWGVELGQYPGQHEQRRYAAQLTIELSFDPDFNFVNGRPRGLKERR